MNRSKLIATDDFAAQMRARIIRPHTREVLVSRLANSDQEHDLSRPPNMGGLGRIRHFRREAVEGWPANPLPLDPAYKALGIPPGDLLEAQVFQNAACAWRCWYCYVPFNLLAGDERRSVWTSAEELVQLYQSEPDAPQVIDLTGGSPDLTPEWVVWMMEALDACGLSRAVYLWSDDNLSTDYVFTVLSKEQRLRLASYANYGRVCCFKSTDAEAFTFNTGASKEGFDRQFDIFQRYLHLGIDLYGYVTLTGPNPECAEQSTINFLDRLQALAELLPLRVIPLRITSFGAMVARTSPSLRQRAAETQEVAIAVWTRELERRFSPELLDCPVTDVVLRPL